jgi:putative SOS response-associated peptidase YedK
MCRRYGRRADKQRIAAAMEAGYSNVFDEIPPSFNVAPQTFQPVVRLSRDSGEREIALMRWGLIPWWAKDGKIGFSTINAKAETLSTSPAFREAFQRRRCLVPADWF